MATIQEQEQQALSGLLQSQEQGGAALGSGSLGAGADVPAVLEQDPATRQLLQESIYTQTGQSGAAQASSDAYRGVAPVPAPTPATAPLPEEPAPIVEAPLAEQPRSLEPTLTAEDIRQAELDKLQGEIDLIRQSFEPRFAAAQQEANRRTGQTRGLSAAGGTTFGAFGAQQLGQTESLNAAQFAALQREQAAMEANARAQSEGRSTVAVQEFEAQARAAAQQEIDNRYREQTLANQQAQFGATQDLQRELALGLIGGQDTLEGREFLYGQEQDVIANAQRQQTIDQQMTIAEASGKQLIAREDGSYDLFNPFTQQVEGQVIGPDPYLLSQNALRGSGGGGGAGGVGGGASVSDLGIYSDVLSGEILISDLTESEQEAYNRAYDYYQAEDTAAQAARVQYENETGGRIGGNVTTTPTPTYTPSPTEIVTPTRFGLDPSSSTSPGGSSPFIYR